MADPINPKVANGLGAAGSSAPFAIILVYYLNKYAGPLPPEIAAAYASLLTAAAGFLGGWLTKLEQRDPPAVPPVLPPV